MRLPRCTRKIIRSTTPIIFRRERDRRLFARLTNALAAAQQKRGAGLCSRSLERPFAGSVNILSNRKGSVGHGASLMKVFMPYLVWNTVFDNTRVTAELGRKPVPFSQYSYPL